MGLELTESLSILVFFHSLIMGAVDTFKMMKVLILFTSLVLLILLTWNTFNLSTQVLTPTHVLKGKGKKSF
jgi:hypothetical protein